MELSKFLTVGLVSTLGIGGPGTTAAYFKSQQSIWDVISEDALPDLSEKENWDLLKTSLTSEEGITDSELTKIKSNSDQENTLKNWCINSYKQTYKSWFQKEKEDLLKNVKTACILTIKKKLGEEKVLKGESGDQSSFEKNVSDLKTYNDSTIALTPELNDLKQELIKQTEDPKNKWQKLKEWCEKTYNQGYQGDNNKWKLVNKFCKKN